MTLGLQFCNLRSLLLGFSLAFASPAFAAVVVKKLSKNRVQVNEGTSTGFVKNATICFFDGSGEKVGCGRIVSTKAKKSAVRLKKEIFAKVEKDFEAKISSSVLSKEEQAKERSKGKSAAAQGTKYFVKGLYLYQTSTTSTNQQVSFAPSNAEQPSTLWQPDGPAAPQVSGGLEVGITVANFAFAIGGRFVSYEGFIGKGDVFIGTRNPYATSDVKTSALGFWADMIFWRSVIMSGSASLRASGGIDLESSTVILKLMEVDDTGATPGKTLVDGQSSTMVLAGRGGFDFTYYFGPIGMVFGLAAKVPVFATGPTLSATFDKDTFSKLGGKEEDDLTTSLAHGKNSFGAEIRIGAEYAF